jgi:hypothetical protein
VGYSRNVKRRIWSSTHDKCHGSRSASHDMRTP